MVGLHASRSAASSRIAGNQLRQVREHAQRAKRLNDRLLRDRATQLLEAFATKRELPQTVMAALGLAAESLRRTLGVELYDVQVMAARATSSKCVAEMRTGEGKTFAIAAAAMLSLLRGQTVHVATANPYLAQRDYATLRPAFELLGFSVGLQATSGTDVEASGSTQAGDVIYGTGAELGFAYLREQFAALPPTGQARGTELLGKLFGSEKTLSRAIRPRESCVAIVDEVDNVLLDDAGSPLILCGASDTTALDADACRTARRMVPKLVAGTHYVAISSATLELTSAGIQAIHAPDVDIPFKQLRRPWSDYVLQALRAERTLQRDVDYIKLDHSIQIVDAGTGRIFDDRTWSEGLHQAVEAKEGLEISNEQTVLAEITRQRYFRLYQQLGGMTGTARGCEREFARVYGLLVREIPTRVVCRREIYPTRAFANAEMKWQAIAAEAATVQAAGRPVLIGTRTIRESETIADQLRNRGLDCQLLNGRQDAEEAAVIAQAGAGRAITIATNMAGRGTDIKVDDAGKRCGGLHVIVSQPNDLQRVDRQLVGRSARQGEPGSARTFISADDDLIQFHGPWLDSPMRRSAGRNGEVPIDFTRRIGKLQQLAERRQSDIRVELMQQDLARESLSERMRGLSS